MDSSEEVREESERERDYLYLKGQRLEKGGREGVGKVFL